MRRTAAAPLLAGMVGGTWLATAPTASGVGGGILPPITVPVTVPILGSTVSTVLSQVTIPTLPPVTVPPVTVPTLPVPLPLGLDAPVQGVLGTVSDCASFATHQAAQAAIAVDPALAALLNDDRDGVACELLPALPVPVPGAVVPAPTSGARGPVTAATSSGVVGAPVPTASAPAPSSDVPAAAATDAPSAPQPATGSPATATRKTGAASPVVTSPSRATATDLATDDVAIGPGATDGDAPEEGTVAVIVVASLLLAGAAAGTFRQWKLEGLALG